jgi:hypothetical protein
MCVSYEEEDTCVCHMRRRIHVCDRRLIIDLVDIEGR